MWRHKRDIAGMIAVIAYRVPFYAFRAAKELPQVIAQAVGLLWKAMKKAPEKIRKVAEILGGWLGKTACELGSAVAEVFGRLFLVLHTVVTAMFCLMKDLTLWDIWNGFCMLIRAAFVNLPKAFVRGIAGLAEATYDALKALIGVFGMVAWWIIGLLAHIIVYIPVQILHVAEAFGRLVAKGFKEVMVWYDPKRS